MSDPTDLTKRELLDLARSMGIAGRSSMNKAELVAAIIPGAPEPVVEGAPAARALPIPGIGSEDRVEAHSRKRALARRLSSLVDPDRRGCFGLLLVS